MMAVRIWMFTMGCAMRGALVLAVLVVVAQVAAAQAGRTQGSRSQAGRTQGAQTNRKGTSTWQHANLLDPKTRSDLEDKDKFFEGLFTLPAQYAKASDEQKAQMVDQWISDLNGTDVDKAIQGAALVGIVGAPEAAKPLEQAIATKGKQGRMRWVSTRSLACIADPASAATLIDLLDNPSAETRLYSLVGLVEMSGANHGQDKAAWQKWLADASRLPARNGQSPRQPSRPAAAQPSPDKADALRFNLRDSQGRQINSADYARQPVLVMSGSCWCGGCQQDAEPLRLIAERFGPRGLWVIRSVAGDNELAAVNFQRHYRLGFVQLMDSDRSFEKQYNDDGWTFLMLADRQGKVVWRTNGPQEQQWAELEGLLEEMLPAPKPQTQIVRDGVAYTTATLTRSGEVEAPGRNDRFASVATSADGHVYVAFTSNRGGTDDVYLRVFDGSAWSEDLPIAATEADEYDASVIVDLDGIPWVCWTSNAAGGYDVYAARLDDPAKPPEPTRLTQADDDAMEPQIACDRDNRIWVVYTQWQKMGQYSRDREVFVRRCQRGAWSDPQQVSPQDVANYEDHFEPTVQAREDGVVVAWTWDFHPPVRGYSTLVEGPSIFIRQIHGDTAMGPISSVSGKDIDVTPSLAVTASGEIWCGWDRNARKSRQVALSSPTLGKDNEPSAVEALGSPAGNVCTPTVVADSQGRLAAVWCERNASGQWTLKQARRDPDGKAWTGPSLIQAEGNPRFCAAVFDGQGRLWVAYSVQTQAGMEVICRTLEAQSAGDPPSKPEDPDTGTTDPGSAAESSRAKPAQPQDDPVARLRRAVDEEYSYRDMRNVDWPALFERYSPRLREAATAERFANVADELLSAAQDPHLWVKVGDETVGGFHRQVQRNYDLGVLRKTVPEWTDLSDQVSMGRFKDGTGYLLIKSWRKDETTVLTPALAGLRKLADCPALILDVRPNGGGCEPYAQAVAGCFVDRPAVYAKHVLRSPTYPGGWSEVRERTLYPNPDQPRYQGRVAVLMGQANMSSCEAFLEMMKQVSGCVLVGQTSYGSSGNPQPHELGNGVTVWLPSWKSLDPSGACIEGVGIEPDIVVPAASHPGTRDPVLEAARKRLAAGR